MGRSRQSLATLLSITCASTACNSNEYAAHLDGSRTVELSDEGDSGFRIVLSDPKARSRCPIYDFTATINGEAQETRGGSYTDGENWFDEDRPHCFDPSIVGWHPAPRDYATFPTVFGDVPDAAYAHPFRADLVTIGVFELRIEDEGTFIVREQGHYPSEGQLLIREPADGDLEIGAAVAVELSGDLGATFQGSPNFYFWPQGAEPIALSSIDVASSAPGVYEFDMPEVPSGPGHLEIAFIALADVEERCDFAECRINLVRDAAWYSVFVATTAHTAP